MVVVVGNMALGSSGGWGGVAVLCIVGESPGDGGLEVVDGRGNWASSCCSSGAGISPGRHDTINGLEHC